MAWLPLRVLLGFWMLALPMRYGARRDAVSRVTRAAAIHADDGMEGRCVFEDVLAARDFLAAF